MPSYSWKCKQCQKNTEIIRSIAEYQEPPREGDGVGLVYCEQPNEKDGAVVHVWERYIPSGSGRFILQGTGWARDRYQ